MTDVSSTAVYQTFGGKDCRFELRLGEIRELERICGAGVGAIYTRLATLQFKIDDLRETIRLGLIGGGTPLIEAEAMVRFTFDRTPLNFHVQLANDIVRAAFDGAPKADADAGKNMGPRNEDPATSAPSTEPEAPLVSPRAR